MATTTPTHRRWHSLRLLTVENRAPDAADSRHLLHRAQGDHTQAQCVVHWVSLSFVGAPPIASTHYRLHIGPVIIPHYFETQDGIAFKAHDVTDLQALYNQPIRLIAGHGDEFDTGAIFPDLSRLLTRQVGAKWQKRYF